MGPPTNRKAASWRLLRNEPGPRWESDRFEINAALQRACNRCECHPTKNRCGNVAVEVVKEGRELIACCHTCRISGFGPTASEKTKATKAVKAQQASLPGVATKPAKPQYK